MLDVAGVALPKDRTIDGVSIVPAFAGRAVERKIPLFWRTHFSPPGDRVALRIGDWKLVGNDAPTKFELYEIQRTGRNKTTSPPSSPKKRRR